MTFFKQNILSALIILWLVVSGYFGLGNKTIVVNDSTPSYGASYDRTNVTNPWTFGSTLTVTGATTLSGDATVSGGTLNVTTSNTATSSIIVGCIQFYATSTATAHKFQATTTPGAMYDIYGTCPNL